MKIRSVLLLLCLSFLWVSCSYPNSSAGRSSGTPTESRKIIENDPFGDAGERLGKPGRYNMKERPFQNVNIVNGPNNAFRVKNDKCVSSIFFPPFTSRPIPLGKAISFLKIHGVRVIVEEPKQINMRQTLSFAFPGRKRLNLCEVVRAMKAQVTGSVRIDDKGDTVTISPYVKSVWHIPNIGNEWTAEAEIQGEGSGGGGGSFSSSTGGSSGANSGAEYMSLDVKSKNEIKLFDEIEKQLQAFLPDKKAGYFVLNRTTGLLTTLAEIVG